MSNLSEDGYCSINAIVQATTYCHELGTPKQQKELLFEPGLCEHWGREVPCLVSNRLVRQIVVTFSIQV
jgi:hypothetical protein